MKRLGDVAEWLGARVTRLPGVAALACTVSGVYLVTDEPGWAVLSAVPYLLALDRRMP